MFFYPFFVFSFAWYVDDGLSWGLYGGIFKGISIVESEGLFLSPIVSYRSGVWEPYFLAKYNYVNWDDGSLEEDDANDEGDDLFDSIDWDKGHFSYMTYKLGTNIWFTEGFAMNLHVQILSSLDSDIATFSSDAIPGLEFMWNF